MSEYYKRLLESKILQYLSIFTVVAIVGARQVGKSTLAQIIGKKQKRFYISLDDLGVLEAAQKDPHGFIDNLVKPVTIDEIQRVPQLLIAIKRYVDRNRIPGLFLITGSSRFEAIKGVKETLAGRAALLRLNPMTIFEQQKRTEENVVDFIFESESVKEIINHFDKKPKKVEKFNELILNGGFPSVVLELKKNQRKNWFEEYRKTFIERDVPTLLNLHEIPSFMRYITIIAFYSGRLINFSDAARTCGISVDTARRWFDVLEFAFIAQRVYPYWVNISKRISKSPKIFMIDSGLCANILGVDNWEDTVRLNLQGQLLETWVYQQLISLCDASSVRTEVFFFRTYTGEKVDFILERKNKLIPIEVKSSKTLTKRDWMGIVEFANAKKSSVKIGIILYHGDDIIPVSANVYAIPFSSFFQQ